MPECVVSVIVTADNESRDLDACLQSLGGQRIKDFETIVSQNNPQALASAMQRAQGQVVVLTDTRCRFPCDWLSNAARVCQSETSVSGGPVEYSGPGTLTSWATYFSDYGAFIPMAVRHRTDLLPGNNVCYRRKLIENCADLLTSGYRKVFFHWDLHERSGPFLLDPDLIVSCLQQKSAGTFAAEYFRNAREFARTRVERLSEGERIARVLSVPLLAPALLYRRVSVVWKHRQHRLKLLLATPLMALFVVCWVGGEFAGYFLRSVRWPAR